MTEPYAGSKTPSDVGGWPRSMLRPSLGTLSGSSFRTVPSSLGFPARNGSTWMTESTADVYTREKRNVVTAIWTKVADKVNS